MSSETDMTNIQHAWQAQSQEEKMIALADIQEKAGRFRKKTLRRNWVEYIGVGVVIAAFGGMAIGFGGTLFVMGCALIIASAIFMAAFIQKHGTPVAAPNGASLSEAIAHHRAELERELDLARRVPVWYIGPAVPGLVLFVAGMKENGMLDKELELAMHLGVIAVTLAVIVAVNVRAARKLRRQIAALEETRGS